MGLPASATISVSGLVAFGTFTSLAAKIGKRSMGCMYSHIQMVTEAFFAVALDQSQSKSKPYINSYSIAVYELDGQGIDGKIKNFEKPWAMTTGKS
jgi:hypothetical protein